MGGRGNIGSRNSNSVKSFTEALQESREANKNRGMFDESLFSKLPKSLQDDRITAIYKEKTRDGNRYSAIIKWEDGFERSISEFGKGDFKFYLESVLKKDREVEF